MGAMNRTVLSVVVLSLAVHGCAHGEGGSIERAYPAAMQDKTIRPVIELRSDGEIELQSEVLVAWVQERADAVAAYYGRFPVDRLRIDLRARDGAGIRFGMVYLDDGPRMRIDFGRETRRDQLDDDWVLVHEMVHLALPDLDDRHRWLEEGLATYVERIIRFRMGNVDEADVWAHFVWGMPHGLPEPGDRGLDATPTWGRTYWGGALFCMVADARIRALTQGRRGLEDAVRAIVAQGGNRRAAWPLERVLRVGDEATGVPVLTELYREQGLSSGEVDLGELWAKLGVEVRDGEFVGLKEQASWVAVRRGMTGGAMEESAVPPIVRLIPE